MSRAICLLLILSTCIVAHAAEPGLVEGQRDAFGKALLRAQLGDWDGVRPHLELLADYPLRPDLRAAWLRRRPGPDTDAEMASFLDSYSSLGFSRDLRYQWARSLARRGEWGKFLELYRAHYSISGDTELDCLSLTAEIETGPTAATVERARALWLSAFSQPEECDPAFDYLQDGRHLTPDLRRQRIALALPKGQIRLARYLKAKSPRPSARSNRAQAP